MHRTMSVASPGARMLTRLRPSHRAVTLGLHGASSHWGVGTREVSTLQDNMPEPVRVCYLEEVAVRAEEAEPLAVVAIRRGDVDM